MRTFNSDMRVAFVEAILDQAEAVLDTGDAEKAIAICDHALSLAPGHPGALFVRGDGLRALGDMPGDASKALRAQLQSNWQSYHASLQALMEAMRTKGYTDLQPVADLADSNQRLMAISQELYQKIQQESGHSVPPLTQKSREQSLLMQNIALDYASRSASVGASFFGGGEERAIDELAGEFASKLDSLSSAQQNTPEISAALNTIETKWRYIEKSLRNYNENTVPFLISKYSDSIIEGLEGVSAQYAASQH